MRERWDDIEILQAIDRIQERYDGGPVTAMNGMYLMDEINGTRVTERLFGAALFRSSTLGADLGCSHLQRRRQPEALGLSITFSDGHDGGFGLYEARHRG